MVDRNDKRFFDFMCSCGEERKQRCEKVYEDVKSSLDVTDKDFLNKVVYSLANLNNGVAEIVGIPSDMWSAISIEYSHDFDECEKDCDDDEDCEFPNCEWKTQKFWIECDKIHHGLARAYQLVVEFDKSRKNGSVAEMD